MGGLGHSRDQLIESSKCYSDQIENHEGVNSHKNSANAIETGKLWLFPSHESHE